MDLKEAKEIAGIDHFSNDYIIFVWHPNTIENDLMVRTEAIIITQALNKVTNDIMIIGPNLDSGNEEIRAHFKGWCYARNNDGLKTVYNDHLPRKVYLTLLKYCNMLVGNSSSGFYEAPSFGIPVINIGDRQKGRIKPINVVDCPIDAELIKSQVQIQTSQHKFMPENPYYTGNAADKIAETIVKIKNPQHLLQKRFYELRH
jgi:UDP-N-acetylglucosamine 2-epimerase